MAMSDLVIRPRVGGLRYASNMFDELRMQFGDIMARKDVSAAVYAMAQRGRGRCISAKATVDDAIADAIAMEAAKPLRREAGSTRKDDSAGRKASPDLSRAPETGEE